jgi:hypothetical protein
MTKVSGTLDIFYLQDMSGTEAAKNKAAYTREGRRQLFALLQGARGSTGNLFFSCSYSHVYFNEARGNGNLG